MSPSIFENVLTNLPKFNVNDYPDLWSEYPKQEEVFDIRVFDQGNCLPMPLNDIEDPESLDPDINEDGAIEGGVRQHGVDVLAFYKSYRNVNNKPFIGKWGIFYINKGIRHIAQMIDNEFPSNGYSRKIAIDFLWHHEIYHAKFDIGILGFEALTQKHIYLPQKVAFKRSQCHQPEEALANANTWKYAKSIDINISRNSRAHHFNIPGISQFFYDFMKNQVGAYSRFDENNFELRSETAAGVFKNRRSIMARCDELAPWIGLVPNDSTTRRVIPEHLVLGIKYTNLISPARFIPFVKEISESKDFLADIPAGHKTFWEKAKTKLYKSSCLPGLDFKLFNPPDIWSARINDNFRAHLTPVSIQHGKWKAISYGNHKKMGHG
jgi:hypothetical protein